MASGKVWERLRDEDGELEPNLWFDRFTDYRLMGAGRSLLGCVNQERVTKGHKKSNYTPGSWREAFEEWNWDERAEAWDEQERQLKEAEWEKRRDERREKDWQRSGDLDSRVDRMLNFPLQEVKRQESEDGKTVTTIIKPVGWRFSDIPKLAEMASRLGRLGAEMETDSRKLDVTTKGEKILGPVIFLPAVEGLAIGEADASDDNG